MTQRSFKKATKVKKTLLDTPNLFYVCNLFCILNDNETVYLTGTLIDAIKKRTLIKTRRNQLYKHVRINTKGLDYFDVGPVPGVTNYMCSDVTDTVKISPTL